MNAIAGMNRQQGAAMMIALVMLLVLTLLATSSARMTLLEERMTGNTQDHQIAFQAAEAALRAGEAEVLGISADDVNDANGLFNSTPGGELPIWRSVDWETDDVLTYDGFDDAPGNLAQASASYLIELIPPNVLAMPEIPTPLDGQRFYRVTARGIGITGNSIVMLQSTVKP